VQHNISESVTYIDKFGNSKTLGCDKLIDLDSQSATPITSYPHSPFTPTTPRNVFQAPAK